MSNVIPFNSLEEYVAFLQTAPQTELSPDEIAILRFYAEPLDARPTPDFWELTFDVGTDS